MATENEKNDSSSAGPESSSPEADAAKAKAEDFLDQLAETGGEFTNENIDEFLEMQDPEFAQQLGDIKKDSQLTVHDPEIDEDTAALHDEIARWRDAKGLKRTAYLILPFLPRVSLAIKKLKFRLFAFIQATKIRLKHFLYYLATAGRRKAQAKIAGAIKAAVSSFTSVLADVKHLSLKLKLAFLGLIVLLGASGVVLYLTWKGKLIPQESRLFLVDLAENADEVHDVDPQGTFENFYDNVRSTPNLLLIQKIVVNIRASKNSGPNPMLAGELFVEGLNPDVVIEVKDREAFFRDTIQRTTEDFTFDQLSSADGKQLLIQSLLKEINRNLTTGELRNVRIKTFILKP